MAALQFRITIMSNREKTKVVQLKADQDKLESENTQTEELTQDDLEIGSSGPDPFSLDDVAVKEEELTGGVIVKTPTAVTIGTPDQHKYIRVNPDPQNLIIGNMVRTKSGLYLISSKAKEFYAGEIDKCILYYFVYRDGTPGIWPVVLEAKDELSTNPWHESGREVAELAKTTWLRVIPLNKAGCYLQSIRRRPRGAEMAQRLELFRRHQEGFRQKHCPRQRAQTL
jgi:hypothetical protein